MAAKANLIMTNDIQVTAREIDFVTRFERNWQHLRDILGIMRPIKKQPGAVLKSKYAEGTLQSGLVGEGEEIPYSKFTVKEKNYAEMTIAEYIDAIAVITIDETPTLGTLTVNSVAGTASGDTKITVNPTKENANNVYKYKVAADAVTVGYGQNLRNWTSWDGKADIKAATEQKITVVECDGTYKALNAGSATVTAKS